MEKLLLPPFYSDTMFFSQCKFSHSKDWMFLKPLTKQYGYLTIEECEDHIHRVETLLEMVGAIVPLYRIIEVDLRTIKPEEK